MNKCGHFHVLCLSLLAFHGVLCSEFADSKYALSKLKFHDEISSGDIFNSFWRNSKKRRSLTSVRHGQMMTTDQTQTKQPQSECGDRVLTLLLKNVDVINMRIYGPHGNQLHLDNLAAFCGVSIKTTNTDVRLLFNYDSCYVKRKPTTYVLSLNWYGTDLDLSCPLIVTPPSIICKNKAMELTVGDGTADDLSVALNGEWAPLLYVATQCWHRERSNKGDLIFSIPYTSCGLTVGDRNFDLDLRLKNEMITLSCPYAPVPVHPVKHPEPPPPLPQREPNVHHKPPTGFPTKAIASHVVKEEEEFLVEQPARNAARPPPLHRRSSLLPKLPSLPGSFNLAVNFPFSVPMQTREAHRDHMTNKPVALTPAPTSAPTPDLTDPDSDSVFSASVQNRQPDVSSEQMEEERAAMVTQAPKSEHHHRKHHHKFEKPATTSPQTEPSPDQEYQFSRGPVSSAALYQLYGSSQNFPKLNLLEVNPAFASLAQYIPPGYFLCSYDNQQPPIHPHMFRPPVSNQPLQYQKPSFQKLDIAPLAPVNPAVPPMKGYSEPVLQSSAVASRPHHSGTPLFQPTQHLQPSQYLYQSSYDRQGSTKPLSPPTQFIPINLQSQTRPHPTFQDSKPFQPQYYQKPNQPHGSVQQPWSTRPFLFRGLTQESRPFVSASSQTPEYLRYPTGGDQSLDVHHRSVVHAPGTGISSRSQYLPSQFSTFSYQPEKLSADVFTENMRSSPKEFFQPRSKSLVPSPRTTGKHGIKSLPPPQEESGAQVAKLPYRQGPSVKYMQNPHVHPERPSELSHQKPQ